MFQPRFLLSDIDCGQVDVCQKARFVGTATSVPQKTSAMKCGSISHGDYKHGQWRDKARMGPGRLPPPTRIASIITIGVVRSRSPCWSPSEPGVSSRSFAPGVGVDYKQRDWSRLAGYSVARPGLKKQECFRR